MYGRLVEPDLHAGAQERLVVRALRVVDEGLVADLRDEELDVHAALGRAADRAEHGLVGHEVRAGEDDALLGRVHEGEEELQVVLVVVPGTARHHLAVEVLRRRLLPERHDLAHRRLAGLEVPVRGEDRLEARDDRPLDAGDELLPLQAAADVAALVVASGR